MAEHQQGDDWDPVAGLNVQETLSLGEDEMQNVVDYQIQHAKISLIGPTAGQVLGVINRLEATASILNRKQTDYAERLANRVLEEADRIRDRHEHDWRLKSGRVLRKPIRKIDNFREFCSGCGAKRTISVSGSPGHPDTFEESIKTDAPNHCPTPHDWQTLRAHGDLEPDGWARWENRIEICATCDVRRQRQVKWDGLDRVVSDEVLLTDPDPLPICK